MNSTKRRPTTVTMSLLAQLLLLVPATVSGGVGEASSMTFDIFELGLTTRAGFCAAPLQSCTESAKGHSYPLWTISAFWPSYSNGSQDPENCSNAVLSPLDVQTIRPNLDSAWPSYTSRSREQQWQEEFAKHGTCAISQHEPNLSTPLQYFERAIDLYRKYDIATWLESANIRPSNKQPVPMLAIKQAIFRHFVNGNFQLYCRGVRDGSQILHEIRFCVDREWYLPANCHDRPNKCRSRNVWYLESSSVPGAPSLFMVLAAIVLALAISRS